jgi:hypothetical protein
MDNDRGLYNISEFILVERDRLPSLFLYSFPALIGTVTANDHWANPPPVEGYKNPSPLSPNDPT